MTNSPPLPPSPASLVSESLRIRCISLLGPMASGKTTLLDCWVQKAGWISAPLAGRVRYTDTLPEEVERGHSIKATCLSLVLNYDGKGDVISFEPETDQDTNISTTTTENKEESSTKNNFYLIHFLDTPGHVELSGEVSAALRITDGAVIVVDVLEPMAHITHTLVQQAFSERVKPVLFLNQFDRAMFDLHLSSEQIYQACFRAVDSVNQTIAMHPHVHDDDLGKDAPPGSFWQKIHPQKGTVAFGSARHQWAFSLTRFGEIYSAKFGVKNDKMITKLWGDWHFDAQLKDWTCLNRSRTGTELERSFSQFVLTPIMTLSQAILAQNHGKVIKMCTAIGIHLDVNKVKIMPSQQLLERVMRQWIPASDALLELVVCHLPSPVQAQRYRIEGLYKGPVHDKSATAMRNCDVSLEAPLCLFISKLIPVRSGESNEFYALGRVFSGRIAAGQKVRVMGPSYVAGKKSEVWVKTVQSVALFAARNGSPVDMGGAVPAGNICCVTGFDRYFLRSSTLATDDCTFPLKTLQLSHTPSALPIRCSVEPKESAELPKLIEGLKRLTQADSTAWCFTEDSGEHVIACLGTLHLDLCLQQLQIDCMNVEVNVSGPYVPHRETCLTKSSQTCLAKSANRHNRIWGQAEPLNGKLVDAIDSGIVVKDTGTMLGETLKNQLVDNYGWDPFEARRVWAFGPEDKGPNVLVDMTKGVQGMYEAKESLTVGFQSATQQGPLSEEPMRGVRINVIDLVSMGDAIHRGMGQMMPAARRLCFSTVLTAEPRLLEPMLACHISVPRDEGESLDRIYRVLTQRRGHVHAEELSPPAGSLRTILAYVPVVESFGLSTDIFGVSHQQQAHRALQCKFDHWDLVSGSPYDNGSKCQMAIAGIRRRKGLKDGVPELSKFLDLL